MIELILSSDGKHTIHASAKTPAELSELGSKAKALYEKIIQRYGNKAQMWQLAIDKEPARLKNAREIPPRAESSSDMVPVCPIHKRRMKLHHGRYGDFWSCKAFSEQDGWCKHTVNILGESGGSSPTAC